MNEILNSEGDYARSCRVFSAIYLHAVRISERLEANLSQDGRPAGNLSWLADFRFDSETTAATSVEVCHRSLPTAHILLRLTSTTQSKKSSPRSPSVSIIICISPRSKLASKPGIPAHYWPCIFNAILLLQFILDFLETGDNASIKMVSTNGFFNRVA